MKLSDLTILYCQLCSGTQGPDYTAGEECPNCLNGVLVEHISLDNFKRFGEYCTNNISYPFARSSSISTYIAEWLRDMDKSNES